MKKLTILLAVDAIDTRFYDERTGRQRDARELSPASRAFTLFNVPSWGLRPRLYACACFAGLVRYPSAVSGNMIVQGGYGLEPGIRLNRNHICEQLFKR